MRKALIIVVAGLLGQFAVSAAAAPLATQSSTVSGVTFSATPGVLSGGHWEFDVVLETHAGELNDDLVKTTSLVVDDSAPLSPVAWRGDAPGGHHRKGVLEFRDVAAAPRSIVLRFVRPGEPAPRVFRWQLR